MKEIYRDNELSSQTGAADNFYIFNYISVEPASVTNMVREDFQIIRLLLFDNIFSRVMINPS